MTARARVVLLNGVGSAGKGSIAKALQAITDEPFLHVEMDAFLAMMPESLIGHPDGLVFETLEQDGKPAVAIHEGPLSRRVFRGMRHAIAAMAAVGNDLIVDDVLIGPEKAEYLRLLRPFDLMLVGVMAPLDVLEDRERARGDRLIGLARWQVDRVHRDMAYDLTVDTSTATPEACARIIKQRFGL